MIGRREARSGVALAIACAALLMLASCDSGEGALAGECGRPEPASDLSVLPDGLELDEFGTVVRAAERHGFVSARAIATDGVEGLYSPMTKLLRRGGYEIVGEDNEGFEAEIYFTRGADTGSILLRQGNCGPATNIILTFGH
ncbi:MAG: hypothetical protein ACRDKF_07405 [Actinomycetota bacterium]